MKNVGIIGLGLMGQAMAERLLAGGYEVLGFDIDPERVRQLVERGGRGLPNAAGVAGQSDGCVLSLPTSDIARAVLTEIGESLGEKFVVDTTTGDPEMAVEAGQRLQRVRAAYLEATVVGSSKQVSRGDVVVLAGGGEEVFERARPLLNTFARQCFYLGGWGSGTRMKLVANLVLGLNRAALAEGLSFAAACGLDLSQTLDVLQSSLAYSRIMDTKGLKMITGDFSVEARLAQHHKDVRLMLTAADRAGLDLPLTRAHDELLGRAESLGLGDDDNSAIIRAYSRGEADRG